MKIDKYLKLLSEKFNPDSIQKERIKGKIFTELNLPATRISRFNFIDLLNMNRKIIIGMISLSLVAIFIGVPILFNSSYFMKTDLLTTIQEGADSILEYDGTESAGILNNSQEIPDGMERRIPVYPSTEENEDTQTKEADRAKQKSAELSLRVENINNSIDSIYELVSSIEGYVVSSDYSTKTAVGYGAVIIRVPSEKFDFTIKELRKMAVEVLSEHTNILDLQNEIADANNNLTELRKELEERYTALENAPESGKKAIQDEIDSLENQIQILEDDLQVLTQKTSYSTIEISLSQNSDQVGNSENLGDIIEQTLEMAKEILYFWSRVGIWMIIILPAALLPLILVFAGTKFRKGIRSKSKE